MPTAQIEIRDLRDGNTPLINAAFEPLSLSVLSELLARGADPNVQAGRDGRESAGGRPRSGRYQDTSGSGNEGLA